MIKFIFRKLSIILLFVSLGGASAVFAQGQDSQGSTTVNFYEKPAVFIIDLKINSQTKEKIEGSFTVRNDEIYEVYNLNYRVMLFKGDDLNNSEFIDIQYEDDPQVFYVLRKSSSSHSFSYKIPQNINPGEYRLRLQIGSANPKMDSISMQEFSWRDAMVNLGGGGQFLEIKNFEFLGGENNSFDSNAEIKIGFDVSNPSASSITAFPRMIVDNSVIKKIRTFETFGDAITFEPKKTRAVELVLPKISQADQYEILLQLVSDKRGSDIYSPVMKRDFKIKGDFAEVLFIYHDKESYKKGDIATVEVTYLGFPEDPKSETKKIADLTLIFKNQETGKACSSLYKTSFSLKEGLGQQIASIPVTANCLKPFIAEDFLIDGKSIDNNDVYAPNMINLSQKISEEINAQTKRNIKIIIGIFAGLGVILFIYLYKRKRPGANR